MRALIIETSTERGLVAFVTDNQIVWSKELPFGFNQSKSLMPELQAMIQALAPLPVLDCIGVGVGPGSYTGVRIGVSVAKTLAYAWKLPLIGVCSLKAFVPQEPIKQFAAIIDAKIGGAYIIKGYIKEDIQYEEPMVCSLPELGSYLEGVSLFVTPAIQPLKGKLDRLYPHAKWDWQEVPPSALHLGHAVRQKFEKQEWNRNGQMELLYLRKTEAEIEREKAQKESK